MSAFARAGVAVGLIAVAAGGLSAQSVSEGALLVDARLRYEHAALDGLDASDALTLRMRLGFETPSWKGLSALLEGQLAVAADEDAYDPYPGPQGPPGRTIIADGPDLRLNRASLQYRSKRAQVVAGRQRLILDNVRFIGDVGWRQNGQVYDGVTGRLEPHPRIALLYGYLARAVRVFGREAEVEAQRRYDMGSHLVHAAWRPLEGLSLVGYGYLIRIRNSPADSGSTWGLFAAAERRVEAVTLSARAEYARQTENDRSPPGAEFGLDYALVETKASYGRGTLTAGFESLGGDGQRGFRTPLATLHAHNGWADVFGTTPSDGLRDLYGSVALRLPRGLSATAVYHGFGAARGGVSYGRELDLLLTRKIGPRLTAVAKYARYRGDPGAPADLRPGLDRLTLHVDLALERRGRSCP